MKCFENVSNDFEMSWSERNGARFMHRSMRPENFLLQSAVDDLDDGKIKPANAEPAVQDIGYVNDKMAYLFVSARFVFLNFDFQNVVPSVYP